MAGIDLLAVLAAAVASFALGGLWYSGAAFLGPWQRAAGREPALDAAVFAATFGFALVSAGAFAWWLGPDPGLGSAVAQGAAVGACIAAASLGINYQFAARGLALWLIDGGFHVARFALFGLVLALWP